MKKKILITILLILLAVLIFITKSYGFGVNELNGGVKIDQQIHLLMLEIQCLL